jgi:hypothetical protein
MDENTTPNYFPYVEAIPYRGETELEIKAHLAFEAQLRYTAQMIDRVLTSHAHYTDDCGDELLAALDLSMQLQQARMDGPESVLMFIRTLAMRSDCAEDGEEGPVYTVLAMEYADSCSELSDLVSALNSAEA